MAELTSGEIADMVGGELRGPADVAIADVAGLQKAGPHDLSYVADDDCPERAKGSTAGAIISHCPLEGYDGAVIICEDPRRALARVLIGFAERRFPPPQGVSESACISETATVADGAAVGPGTVVADEAVIQEGAVVYPLSYVGRRSRVGRGTVILPHVCIRADVTIGSNCRIHSHVSIGEDGFGYLQREGRHVKLPHVGKVRIGDDVEIGSMVTIDRAMLDETVIGDGVKIDSHSHLAHNVEVGDHSLMVAYAKLAGSVKLGKGVLLAEDVGITDHVTVGDGARLAGGSGVRKDVPPGETLWGYPARPLSEQRRIWALQGKLPEFRERIRRLEEQVEELRGRLGEREDDAG